MTDRLTFIDEMRGIAILTVVIDHIYLPHTSEGIMHPIASIIYSFHMSFFFFISGYINQKTNKINSKGCYNFISKKATSLLIPYLFWLLIAPLFINNSFPSTIQELIARFSFFPNKHYWFLPTLFIFMMLYLIGNKLIKTNKAILLVSTLSIGCFCICGFLFHQYFLFIYGIYWFSFLFGSFLSQNKLLEEFITKKIIFGISALLLCIAWKFYPIEINNPTWRPFLNIILSFFCSLLGSISLLNFFRKVQLPLIIQKYLQEMGKYSLIIYVVPITLLPKDFIFSSTISATLTNLIILFIAVLQTLISYTFGRIIYEIPFLSYIMFGKKAR